MAVYLPAITSLMGYHGSNYKLKSLCIVVTDNDDNYYIHNFYQIIWNLKTTINIVKQRRLTLRGEITILNNLALVSLMYVARVVKLKQKKQKTVI